LGEALCKGRIRRARAAQGRGGHDVTRIVGAARRGHAAFKSGDQGAVRVAGVTLTKQHRCAQGDLACLI
jgi:hypothetical protein